MTETPQAAGHVLEIPLAQLKESPQNARRTFDLVTLKELAQSLTTHGQLEPALVRAHPSDPDTWEIVAGARRLRASRLAGLGTLRCIVRHLTDAEVAEIQLVENLQREGLSPLEEAAGYHHLRALAKGLDVPAIAARVGKSPSYVFQRLRLLGLQTSARALLEAGTISVSQAILLAPLPEALQAKLAQELKGWLGARPVTELEHQIEQQTHALAGVPWRLEDATLLPKAGACTGCPYNTRNAPDGDQRRKPACLNPTCWAAKMTAHLGARERALKKAGTPVARLTGTYPAPKGKVYLSYQLRLAKKECKTVTVGLVEPPGTFERPAGAELRLCLAGGCRLHGTRAEISKADRERRAREAAARKRELAAQAQTEAWTKALRPKLPTSLAKVGPLELRALVSAVDGRAPDKPAAWLLGRLWDFAAESMDPKLLPALARRYHVPAPKPAQPRS